MNITIRTFYSLGIEDFENDDERLEPTEMKDCLMRLLYRMQKRENCRKYVKQFDRTCMLFSVLWFVIQYVCLLCSSCYIV